MGRIVVGDDVDVESGRRFLVDLLEKIEPFNVGVSTGIPLKDVPSCIVEGCEKRSCSMACIVVCGCSDVSDPKRKSWLSSLERLALRLLITAEHNRLFRWRKIQSNDVPEFGDKVRVV